MTFFCFAKLAVCNNKRIFQKKLLNFFFEKICTREWTDKNAVALGVSFNRNIVALLYKNIVQNAIN